MNLLDSLHAFTLTKLRQDLPLYNKHILKWWINDHSIHNIHVAIRNAITCFRYMLSDMMVYYCENITQIDSNNRVLHVKILLDDRCRYMFCIDMEVVDFYNFIYGIPLLATYDRYDIVKYNWVEKALDLIINNEIVCEDVELQVMFMEIPNSHDIEFFVILSHEIAHRYDCLIEFKSLECLPVELVRLIQEYCEHNG